jgi:2-polyprenyl-6-hydroxyphenyl methylase/3-demethylubiquinone-9 3-methyltransferase
MDFDLIDNSIYHAENDQWWRPDSALYMLKKSINPVRVGYFKKILFNELKVAPIGSTALEVGCGGGILCEEIVRMGFGTTGIDPSEQSLHIAIKHAETNGLEVRYEKGTGVDGRAYDNRQLS